ncbi:hypothetical protein AB0M79_30045 [Polymorphospora sp. NPDC051019]|uniref:AfsR/SARP family transcriptional regulator n=1 Tax=Polymorphospora sp. NPDC051019 TaxID=3155725 RepID=UPI00342A395C
MHLVGWPLPRHWPSRDQAATWIADPLNERTVAVAIALLGWALWLLIVATVAAHLLVRLQRTVRWLRRIPVPTPLQAAASGLVGATVLTAAGVDLSRPAAAQPSPATGTPADHKPDRPTPTRPDDSDAGRAQLVGVELPDGGWLPYVVAQAVVSAAALIWYRRRRDYIPNSRNVDLAPLPATVAAVQATLDPPDSETASWRPPTPQRPPGGDVIGPVDLPPGLLHLTGPGAADAGRGLLVAAALTRHNSRHTLVTTSSDINILLDTDPNVGGTWRDIHGLLVSDTLDDAMTTFDQDTNDHEPQTGHEGHPAKSTLVLLTHASSGPAIIDHPAPHTSPSRPATTVLIGEPASGAPTWHIAADGNSTTGQRMCILGAASARDLLTLARHAHPTGSEPHENPADDHTTRPHASGTGPPPPADSRLRLTVLGEPKITWNDTPLTVRRNAAWQILILLAVHPGGLTSEQMTEAIWPQLRPHTVTGRFYTTISELRIMLHTTTGTQVIDRDSNRYRLRPEHIYVDLWQLHCKINTAGDPAVPTPPNQALQAIIDAPPGLLAADQTWPWLTAPRETIRQHLIDAHTTLANHASPHAAIKLLQQAIALDPLNKHLHHQAIQALAAAGQDDAIPTLIATYHERLTHANLPFSNDLHDLTSSPVARAHAIEPD